MGDVANDVERHHCRREVELRHVQDAGRPGGEGRLELGLIGRHVRADLDERSAGETDREVVGNTVGAVDDELGRQPRPIERRDAVRHAPGDERRRRQEQAGSCATAHEGRLVVGQLGDPPSDRGLELGQVNERLGGLGHRCQHGRRHERTAEDRKRRPTVDDRLDAERAVDVARRPARLEGPLPGHAAAISPTARQSSRISGSRRGSPTAAKPWRITRDRPRSA